MRPSRDDMLMEIAVAAAQRSTCSRASVGAVLSREGRPLSLGFNGAPSGMPHCDHACDCGGLGSRVGHREPKGDPELHYTDCNSEQPCLLSVHAELNAILFAAKHGVATDGAELHSTLSPCRHCCFLIINAGIKRVVYLVEYRLTDGLDLLENAGIDCEQHVR